MTPIDYLLLAGVLLAGGYVVSRLFVGWLRSSVDAAEIDRDNEFDAPVGPERESEGLEKAGAPWRFRK
jgi:hypothetical protein